jgi:peptidyl-prolyl cis-trans isomerase C
MKKTNFLGILVIILLITCAFFLPGCDKLPFFSSKNQPKPGLKIEGTVLAKINSDVITLEDFNFRVDNINQVSETDKIDTLDKKKNFLQALIQQDLFYQRAISLGLDKDSQVNKAVEEFRKSLLVQKLIGNEIGGVNVEAKEIENYYNVAKDNYRVADEVKVSEIVVVNEDSAKQVLIELLKGGDFASLAQQYSKAPSARNGGSLGWIKKGARKLDRFDEVAFSLKKGEISNIFSTPEGFFIVKLEDKKGGGARQLSEVWDQIKSELLNYKQGQRLTELERDLRTKANIEIHEELLR